MKKYGFLFLGLIMAMAAFTQTTEASEYMTPEQAMAVFKNKTFDGVYISKDTKFKAFEAPGGDHHVLRTNGKRDKGRKWKINDEGQHCTTLNKKPKKWRCRFVKDMGNGDIGKFDDKGTQTHRLFNFRDGNQL